MHNYRFLLPLLLVIYIFSPTLFSWMLAPTTIWYKPYIVWLLIIISVYMFHKFNDK